VLEETLDVAGEELLIDVLETLEVVIELFEALEVVDVLEETLDVAGIELLLDVLEVKSTELLGFKDAVDVLMTESNEAVETLLKALEVVETELSPEVIVFSAESVLDSLVGVPKADDIDVLVVGLIDVVKLTLKVGKLVVFLVISVKL
jgi:hypothetical protein